MTTSAVNEDTTEPIIGAEFIESRPWRENRVTVRQVLIDGKLWFVAADVCRALELTLTSKGRPNVTEALRGIGDAARRFARLEVARGTFQPFTRFALISPTGLATLLERKAASSRKAIVTSELRERLLVVPQRPCQGRGDGP